MNQPEKKYILLFTKTVHGDGTIEILEFFLYWVPVAEVQFSAGGSQEVFRSIAVFGYRTLQLLDIDDTKFECTYLSIEFKGHL